MILPSFSSTIRNTAIISAIVLTAACGGSGGTTPTATVAVTGTVSAPGGTVAFNAPTGIEKFFAQFWGSFVNAAIQGVAPVGAGVNINLIEVDADGLQIAVLVSGTTDATGAFSIDAPAGFTPGPQYVLRAAGTTENIDARVTATAVDLDPVSDASSDLVATIATDLTLLTVDEVIEIQNAVDEIAQDIDPSGLTADQLSTALQTETTNDEESNNILNSIISTGQICGTVTDSAGSALANIRVVARDFGNWVTRSKAKTDATGAYCLNVPKTGDANPDIGGTFNGEYILGVFNRTNNAKRSASEWFATSGTAYDQFDAEKVTVANTTTLTRNFQLEDGARITGSVTASDTAAPLEGVVIVVRDFDTRTPIATAKVKPDGTYRVSVINGNYIVVARNKTMQAYGTENYDGVDGTNNRNLASPVLLNVADDKVLDFVLEPGTKISGVITDGVAGTPVTGQRVMVNVSTGGPADRLRTNKQGKFRIWMIPGTYDVLAYGQSSLAVDLTATNQTVNFESADVSRINATIQDAAGNPVSQVKVRLYDEIGTFINFEITNSDGTVTAYTDQTGNHLLEARVDTSASFGTSVYDGKTSLLSGDLINVAGANSTVNLPAPIMLPAGGTLTGTVTTDGTTPIANFRVQVRNDNNLVDDVVLCGGLTSANRFTQIRTRGDGTYVVTLPAGVYECVKMQDAAGNGNCATVTITGGGTTTLDFNDGTNTCS